MTLFALILGAALASPPPPAGGTPAGLCAAWAETLRGAYAYLERGDFDVDAHIERTCAAAGSAPDMARARRLLHRSSLAWTDPHLLVGPLDDADPNVWPTSGDIAIALVGGAPRVADVRAGSAADEAGVRPGDTLLSVRGVAVEAALPALWMGLLPDPTDRQRGHGATLLANGDRGDGVRVLTLRGPRGRPRVVRLDSPRDLARAVSERPPVTTRVRPGHCVLRFENSLGRGETISAFDEALAGCLDRPGLVLDLRNTPSGGNTDVARAVIGHFISETRSYQVHEIPAVERRTTVPRRFVEQVLPRAPAYGGRVVVLGGRWTGSMGEGVVIGMHAAAGAHTIVGDMGDLLGALHRFELDGGGVTVELGAEALFHVDGTPREDFRGDQWLESADRDAGGGDPAMAAAEAWLAGP